MFNKQKALYRAFRKNNRIVEGTIIKGDIVSQADFRLDGELIKLFSTGKLVIGPAGIITEIFNKKCRYRR
jgi:cytoskeletal protein CcmA (bactofilin family)